MKDDPHVCAVPGLLAQQRERQFARTLWKSVARVMGTAERVIRIVQNWLSEFRDRKKR